MTVPETRRGLCERCAWAQAVATARGSVFVRCGRSDFDTRFPRYPRLPVLECAGFQARATD